MIEKVLVSVFVPSVTLTVNEVVVLDVRLVRVPVKEPPELREQPAGKLVVLDAVIAEPSIPETAPIAIVPIDASSLNVPTVPAACDQETLSTLPVISVVTLSKPEPSIAGKAPTNAVASRFVILEPSIAGILPLLSSLTILFLLVPWSNFDDGIAAVVLISVLAIVPSAILADVIALSLIPPEVTFVIAIIVFL